MVPKGVIQTVDPALISVPSAEQIGIKGRYSEVAEIVPFSVLSGYRL